MLYEPPTRTDALPIIDLAASASASVDARRGVAREIRKAVCDTGFFYVRNHGVDEAVVAGAFEQGQRFLRRPLAEKERYARGEHLRGYEGIATQATGVYMANGAVAVGDLKDLYNFGYGRGRETPDYLENQWPDDMPGFRERLDAYYAAVDGLGKRLIRLLALSLDLREDFFDDGFRFADSNCRVLRYPPQEGNALPGQMGAGAHTDIGAITILAQDHHEALEVRTLAGDWIRATPIPGTFIVNIGDLMMRWTNDVYKSSVHRVMNNTTDEERYSIVFFFGPRFDTLVECVPTCTSADNPPRYEPIRSGEYRTARLALSYNFRATK